MTVITPTKRRSPPTAVNPWEISRPRLLLPSTLWDQPRPVVTAAAPPGYGKSVLLSQWQEQCRRESLPIVGLTVDQDDRDGDKLILDLAQAVAQRDTNDSESLLDTYGQDGKVAVIRATLSELAANGARAALFIDDVHEFLNRPAETVLRLLLRYQPDRLMLVFSGRAIPRMVACQPLLEGRLCEFTETHLALTQEETIQLLRQHNVEAREELVARVLERTQGWPAVVRLLALTMEKDEQGQDELVERLNEGSHSLPDYLNEMLLTQQPKHLRLFLLQLSLLRRFTASMAAAVTGTKKVAELLDELEYRAFPLARSGGAEPTYRIHPLVREFLLAQLKHSPDTLEEARDRACAWMLRHDHIEVAIEVCLDADDLSRAATLIDAHASQIVQQYGRHTIYLYWLNKLPNVTLAERPEIRLKQAWSLDFLRRHEEAEAIREALEQEYLHTDGARNGPTQPDTFQPELEQAIELQRCVSLALRDQAMESTSRTRRWLSRWPDARPLDRATAHAVLAFSVKALSDFHEGLEHARAAQALARKCGAHYVLVWASMLGVANLIKLGHYQQALHECNDYLPELETCLGVQAPAVMMLHALKASLLYEFNRLSEATDELGRGITALVKQSSVDPIIVGYVTLARLQRAKGQHLEALETLAEGEALGRAQDLPRLVIALVAERIVMMLRYGELDRVESLSPRQELHHFSSGNTPVGKLLEDKASRIQARIAFLKGRYSEACELLAPALRHAKRTGQKRKQAELSLLQALALHENGDDHKALSIFGVVIDLAMVEGYIRVFVDEGKPMQRLLSAYRHAPRKSKRSPPVAAFLDQLSDAFASESRDKTAPPQAGEERLIEPLTTRELQILSKMQSGLSNRELSDTLFITEGTLKWHLQNIYGKLGVNNRLAAVTKAQELELLSPDQANNADP